MNDSITSVEEIIISIDGESIRFTDQSEICACGTTLIVTEPGFQNSGSTKKDFQRAKNYTLSSAIQKKHPQTPHNPSGHILTDTLGRKRIYLDFEPMRWKPLNKKSKRKSPANAGLSFYIESTWRAMIPQYE